MSLTALIQSPNVSLYEISPLDKRWVRAYICSTPETRRICNDPFVLGVEYTTALGNACAEAIKALYNVGRFSLNEKETIVLNLLRGGLNFGLREALHTAFNWNLHGSAFLSAQRVRKSEAAEEWYITESDYKKVYFHPKTSLVFGDVVATGSSLRYALDKLVDLASEGGSQIQDILFFTIGGEKSESIVEAVGERCRSLFPSYRGACVIYMEGRFAVASPTTPISIKITGTDLLRRDSVLAPEFLESQYEDPAYPLERCTIYDAGSRAFWPDEYLEDVIEYWKLTKKLATDGMTFEACLNERMPEVLSSKFSSIKLLELSEHQIERGRALLSSHPNK